MRQAKQWLTVKEAADFIGVSPITIRRWCERGELTCYRIGRLGHRRFKPDDLQRYIQHHHYNAREATSYRIEHILIVDNSTDVVELVVEALTEDGYGVQTATSCVEALEAIGTQLPDLIVLDLVLPNMDGFRLLEYLKQDTKTAPVPVLILTATNDVSSLVFTLTQNVVGHLAQPLEAKQFLQAVRTSLTGNRYVPASR